MSLIDDMRNDNGIKVKDCGNGVESFNFTSKTFKKANWNERSVRARGLFIKGNSVDARSYDKFFAIGERPETEWKSLKENLEFPVQLSFKYNGYLGILSAHFENDEYVLDFHSKSCTEGWYVEEFKRIFYKVVGEWSAGSFAEMLCKNNLSAVFEVISTNDPHIVEYHCDDVILLDLIENSLEFKPKNYSALQHVAKIYNMHIKVVYNIYSYDDLTLFICNNEYSKIEGYVGRDKNNFMFKVKLLWYRYWKMIRGIVEQLGSGKEVECISNYYYRIGNDELAYWLPNFVHKYKAKNGKTPSVITVRNEWEKER
ncbi:MAG TPA: hypothetical protein DCW90_17865 [Lachnospiraceae bacterium]|nr:hypothetical protein [Lachnospiraceae bacterium]